MWPQIEFKGSITLLREEYEEWVIEKHLSTRLIYNGTTNLSEFSVNWLVLIARNSFPENRDRNINEEW